ncbi:MAG: HeH/LEM domain-containing protein [Pseudomonadota bacterium]
MPNTELIPISRGGEYLEVHPTALQNHRELGWTETALREVPTMAELLIARDQLLARERGLDVERERLDAQAAANAAEAERLRIQAEANAAEAQRLADIAAAAPAAAAPAADPDPAGLTVAQLRDALTAKGINFPAGANKAELQALLAA